MKLIGAPGWPEQLGRIGTGLSLILFPLVFLFAFASHPGLLEPHLLGPGELIRRAHGNASLQFAHLLVTLNTALLVVAALGFKSVLEKRGAPAAGLAGAGLAIVGALALAADKGALCLTMSALDTLPESQFAQFMPGLLAMFGKSGYLALLWGLLLLPIGFAVQAVALLKTHAMPRWQGLFLLAGTLFVGTPDGLEIINLGASALMALALVPYGIRRIRRKDAA